MLSIVNQQMSNTETAFTKKVPFQIEDCILCAETG